MVDGIRVAKPAVHLEQSNQDHPQHFKHAQCARVIIKISDRARMDPHSGEREVSDAYGVCVCVSKCVWVSEQACVSVCVCVDALHCVCFINASHTHKQVTIMGIHGSVKLAEAMVAEKLNLSRARARGEEDLEHYG